MANQRWRDATKSVIAMKQVIRATEDARATRIRRNNTMDVQDTSFELVLPALVDGSAVTETGSPAAGASPQAPKQAMAKVHISTTGRFTTTTGPTSTTDTPSSPTSPISSIFVTTHPQSGSIARRLYGNLVDFILNSYWRSRGKKIQASEAVLATYHESWLHGKVPLNMQVRAALRVGPIAIMLNVVEFLFSALSLFFYVRSTYGVFLPSIIQALQLVFTLYFLVDYSLKVYSAAVRIYYVFSLHGIVDLVSSFPSAFFYGRMVPGIGGIPQLFLTFRILRLLKKMLSLILVGSTVFQRIIYLLVYTFGSVFFSAGLFQWVENMASNGNYVCSGTAQDCIDFFEAMYFVIVTMATVGYGDISPRTYPGRLLVILLIIAAIVILPGQISKILEMAARRPYGGSFDTTKVVGSRFVLLCGTISFQTVQTFLSEFYHPMHDQDLAAYPLRVVIMAPFKPTFEVKSLLALYAEMVEFFEGSAINTVDLDRVSARAATAIFILANGRAQDPDNEDASQIVRALSMHRYCGPFTRARIIVELLKPESQTSAIWDDTEGRVEAICPEELRFNLLARSCAVRGLTTFITNLFKSGVTLADGGKEKKKSLSEPWMAEYFRGSSQEVYPVLLPPILHKLRFEEAAEFVFRHSGSLLFGLDVTLLGDGEGESMSRGILLFPKGHSITPEDVGLVIADSVRDAERVSKCVDPGSNSVCAFHRRKNADALPSHMSSLVCCCSCPFPLSCVQRKQREWEQAKALLAEVRERWKTHSAKKGHDHDHDDNYDNVMFKAGGGSDECSAVPPSHVRAKEPPKKTERSGTAGVADAEVEEAAGKEESVAAGAAAAAALVAGDIGGSSSSSSTASNNNNNSNSNSNRSSNSMAKRRNSAPNLLQNPSASAGEGELKGHLERVLKYSKKKQSERRQASEAGEGSLTHTANSSSEGPINNNNNNNNSNNSSTPNSPLCKQFRSLEEAVDMLLQWPPILSSGRPQPVVLEHQRHKIVQHLTSRTLTVTNLSTPHILVCIQGAWPINFFHFVQHVRTRSEPSPPIVALHPRTPTADQWGCVGLFDDVFFVKGSPVFQIDLLRAGVLHAEKVVVLTSESQAQPHRGAGGGVGGAAGGGGGGAGEATEEEGLWSYRGDIQNAITAANVDRLLGPDHERLLVEVQNEATFQYLTRHYHPRGRVDVNKVVWERNPNAHWLLFPSFMHGKAFCPSMMDFLLFGTFYNRNVVEIVRQLVNGGPLEDIPEAVEGAGPGPGAAAAPDRSDHQQHHLRTLDQMPVPKGFVDKPFEELFLSLLHSPRVRMLALGLLRAALPSGAPSPYVVTNPHKTAICREGDLVFVLR